LQTLPLSFPESTLGRPANWNILYNHIKNAIAGTDYLMPKLARVMIEVKGRAD